MDVIYLVYGFAFFLLASVIVAQPHEESSFKLADFVWLLGAFGVIHGFLEWMDLWTLVRGEDDAVNAAKPPILLLSYLFLFEFGRRIVRDSLSGITPSSAAGRLLGPWIYLPLLGAVFFAASTSANALPVLASWSRYLLGFPGATLAGVGFLLYCRFRIRPALGAGEFLPIQYACYIAAFAFVSYGVLGGLIVPRSEWFPASRINSETFQSAVGLPVQLFRAACAALIAFSVGYILRVFHVEGRQRLRQAVIDAETARDDANFHSHRNQLLLQSVNEGIFGVDLDGKVIFINPIALDMLGFGAEELSGRDIHSLIHHTGSDGKPFPREECPTNKVLHDGKAHAAELDFFWRKDGSCFPVEYRSAPIIDNQRVVGAVALFQDITQRVLVEEGLRMAKRAAESASRVKSEFLANMSHEIRTPMNAILGIAEMLVESELNREQRKYVGILQNAGNNLLELINDVLDLSKVEAGQLELDKDDFLLGQMLDEQIDLQAALAHDKGLELALDIKPGVPECAYGDARRLKQCLTNLVGNAIKFSYEGSIVLCVSPVDGQPGMLQFSVSDDGIGIPAEKQKSIFEAFVQVDSSITRRFGGTGLGLAITSRLVQLMGGEIWVTSREGEGSTFCFTAFLPQSDRFVSPPASHADLRGVRVLVVDDLPVNRTIVRQCLEPLGAEIAEADSAKQALSLLGDSAGEGKPFSLALVDCHMPEMDGLELSSRILADPAFGNLKILVLSSDDTAGQRQRAKGLALPFLLKPIKRYELIQAIGNGLRRHALPAPEEVAGTLPVPYRSLDILLAEDNTDNVLLIMAFLKNTPYRVDVAEDGLAAVEKFRTSRYDVVLMDVQMPKMDGYEATAEIRRIEASEGRTVTPVIALTAFALKEDEQRSLNVGCNGHLSKPIKKKVLLEVLSAIRPDSPRPHDDIAGGVP